LIEAAEKALDELAELLYSFESANAPWEYVVDEPRNEYLRRAKIVRG